VYVRLEEGKWVPARDYQRDAYLDFSKDPLVKYQYDKDGMHFHIELDDSTKVSYLHRNDGTKMQIVGPDTVFVATTQGLCVARDYQAAAFDEFEQSGGQEYEYNKDGISFQIKADDDGLPFMHPEGIAKRTIGRVRHLIWHDEGSSNGQSLVGATGEGASRAFAVRFNDGDTNYAVPTDCITKKQPGDGPLQVGDKVTITWSEQYAVSRQPQRGRNILRHLTQENCHSAHYYSFGKKKGHFGKHLPATLPSSLPLQATATAA
jgi:hypothetical protein